MSDEVKRITDYLSSGGLFNPELADHEVVRDLLIDCRNALEVAGEEPVAEVIECPTMGQQTLRELNGRWKFLRYGTKLYTHPQPAAPAQPVPLDAVVKMLEKKATDYAKEFGHEDMGSLSFGRGSHADIKMDYYTILLELADEIREMSDTQTNN